MKNTKKLGTLLKEKRTMGRPAAKSPSTKIQELENSLQQTRLDSASQKRRQWKQQEQYDSSLNCSFASNYQQIIDDYKQHSTSGTPLSQHHKTILKQNGQPRTNKMVQFENKYMVHKAQKDKHRPPPGAALMPNLAQSIEHSLAAQLQANIEKAKVKPLQSEHHLLEEFLEAISLERYFNDLVKHKINSVDTLLTCTKKDLQKIGLAPGHVIKLTKKIDAENKARGEILKEEPKEEEPTNRLVILKKTKQQQESKATIEKQIEQGGKPGCLLQGSFDEEQSHNYFLEALLELRQQNKDAKEKKEDEPITKGILKTTNTKKVENKQNNVVFKEEQSMRESKSMFFHDCSPDSGQMDVFFMPEFSSALPAPQESLCQCKNCRKKFKSHSAQTFCSIECEQHYSSFQQTKCQNRFCNKALKKDNSLCIMKMTFCNNLCFQYFDSQEDKRQYFKDKQYLQEVQQTYHENKVALEAMRSRVGETTAPLDDVLIGDEVELQYNQGVVCLESLEQKYKVDNILRE